MSIEKTACADSGQCFPPIPARDRGFRIYSRHVCEENGPGTDAVFLTPPPEADRRKWKTENSGTPFPERKGCRGSETVLLRYRIIPETEGTKETDQDGRAAGVMHGRHHPAAR